MGLLNARNLRMAKELLEKNRHRIGDVVGKATEKVDKVSGGKTANLSKKAEEAARKYSAGSGATHRVDQPNPARGGDAGAQSGLSNEEVQIREDEQRLAPAEAMMPPPPPGSQAVDADTPLPRPES